MARKPKRPKRLASKAPTAGRIRRKPLRRPESPPANLTEALDAAEYCADNALEVRVPSLLAPFESEIEAEDGPSGERAYSLLALGRLASGELRDAEIIVQRALDRFGPSPDRLYLMTRISWNLRSYDRCLLAGREYEEACSTASSQTRTESLFCSDLHRAQALIWLGDALSEKGEVEQAVTTLWKAILLDKTNSRSYLELIRLFMHLRKRAEALEVLRTGLASCSDKQELLMLKEYLRERPSISACMIVRNEEKMLPECLDSIRDWVDEIIVVDTGSTDATMDIARQYGARVFQQPWENNFAKHRNYSLEQATGDWLFIIDADERYLIEDVPLIIDSMRAGRFSALAVNVLNVYGNDERRVTFCNSVRFFRRDLNLRYEGIVHNVLSIPDGLPVLQTQARLKHLGYDLPPERMEAKFRRTLALLKQQLADNPDDTFSLFNYAELLKGVEPNISRENAEEVIRVATRVTELVDANDKARRHLRLMAFNQLTAVHIAFKEWDKALAYGLEALKLKPDYLDGLIHLGLICYGKKDYPGAIARFQAYLKAQAQFDGSRETWPIILSYPDARDLAYNNLGALYELTGAIEKAKQSYLKAMEINPGYRETASRLARLFMVRGDMENAEKWYRRQLKNQATSESLANLASLCYESGRFEEAESLYRWAIDQFGATSALYNDLGNCLFKMKRLDEAESCYLKATETVPPEPLAWRNLAVVQSRTGRHTDALGSVEKYLENRPDDPQALILAGDLLRASSRHPEAIACFERALQSDPSATAALVGLAESYLAMGHTDAAILGYRKLVEIEPDNSSARERLAQIAETAMKV